MSIGRMTAVFEHSEATGADRLVILAIADAADNRGIAYPLVETVAAMARVSIRAAQYAVRDLVESGELAVITAHGRGRRNVYVVLVGFSQEQREAALEAARVMVGKGANLAPIKGAIRAPFDRRKGAKCDTEKVQSAPSAIKDAREKQQRLQQPTEEREEATAPEAPRPSDEERLLSLSFPSGRPTETARAAVIDRAYEAIRQGATWPLLGWAAKSPNLLADKPWHRIAEAGERTAQLLQRLRQASAGKTFTRKDGETYTAFVGRTLLDALAWPPHRWTFASGEALDVFKAVCVELRGYERQAREWPPVKKGETV
jgi:hypothetical protein